MRAAVWMRKKVVDETRLYKNTAATCIGFLCFVILVTMANPNTFDRLSREQLVVKIAHDITRYPSSDVQVKLSLFQDLVITLLPYVSDDLHRQLMAIRCHKQSENVVDWLDAMLTVYLKEPKLQGMMSELSAEQLSTPY